MEHINAYKHGTPVWFVGGQLHFRKFVLTVRLDSKAHSLNFETPYCHPDNPPPICIDDPFWCIYTVARPISALPSRLRVTNSDSSSSTLFNVGLDGRGLIRLSVQNLFLIPRTVRAHYSASLKLGCKGGRWRVPRCDIHHEADHEKTNIHFSAHISYSLAS